MACIITVHANPGTGYVMNVIAKITLCQPDGTVVGQYDIVDEREMTDEDLDADVIGFNPDRTHVLYLSDVQHDIAWIMRQT